MNKGVLYAVGAYTLWGVFPLYFKILHNVPALQIVGHRVIWSVVFLVLTLAVRRELADFRAHIDARTLAVFAISGLLLSMNWLVYVWGINAGFVVETSLGYFINPLVNVLLGMVFLRERLRPLQWLPVGLAAAAVAYLTISHGSLPWIALALAFTFGLYGLIRKVAPLGSLYGLALETMVVFVPALIYLLVEEGRGEGLFGHSGVTTLVLLILTGAVTVIPLLLFASGARRVPLSTMGLIQFIAPTLQFLSGVFIFGEPFTQARLVGFSLIWLALILFTAENLLNWRKKHAADLSLLLQSKSGP
jgi:chloramphenicol-sensitive protein RarD